MIRIAAICWLSSVSILSLATAEVPQFETIVLDPEIGKVCYAVTAADVDGDGKLDAVAISEREAMWYRNPDWEKHVMIRDAVAVDHVCIAAEDIDGDGKIDFALGAGWPKNGGTIHWLQRGESLNDPWQVHSISAEPWTHRMRFANVLGQDKPQLVVTPLNKTTGDGIRLMAFPIPQDPVAGPWNPVILDASLDRAHNHWHIANPSGLDSTIVASQQGLTLIEKKGNGGFVVESLATGADGDKPNEQGSGEVKSGQLSGRQILATIEPMHGNQVVVYLDGTATAGRQRVVLDDTFVQGHAIWCVDLDSDGNDEVIAAHRESGEDNPAGIFIYQAKDQDALEWTRHRLDAPMACEDLWCADFNGDQKMDVLAGGRATHNVKLYLQR